MSTEDYNWLAGAFIGMTVYTLAASAALLGTSLALLRPHRRVTSIRFW
ncbi:MAG: hypothetical protein JO110_20800 [Acetobacteraceae bacterium]|nr:hypothetical protein [Acetobacteraceae bacterium]